MAPPKPSHAVGVSCTKIVSGIDDTTSQGARSSLASDPQPSFGACQLRRWLLVVWERHQHRTNGWLASRAAGICFAAGIEDARLRAASGPAIVSTDCRREP